MDIRRQVTNCVLFKVTLTRLSGFLMEGNRPNLAIYDDIHNHELYINATTAETDEAEQELWGALNTYSYNRFTLA